MAARAAKAPLVAARAAAALLVAARAVEAPLIWLLVLLQHP